ncbi:MAG: SOS response-associated peptidase family protein [Gammaproteobacteria bacterium]|nr:SOS response-associated peptidase family protein [Gammaproteobacteria bacterium]
MQEITSFSIVTTAVNAKLEFLHDRQPVMLSRAGAHRWMSRDVAISDLRPLFNPHIPIDLDVVPVSAYVGDPRNKEPRCVAPVAAALKIDRDRGD